MDRESFKKVSVEGDCYHINTKLKKDSRLFKNDNQKTCKSL